LEKITRDVVSYVQTIHGETGKELRNEIEASFESKRGQIVLIIGNKGAGKTTFIDRFFKFKLDNGLRAKCLVLKVDLAEASGSVDGLQEWLTDQLIASTEAALYDGRNPSFDELLGIFFDHYQRWSTGEHKHLYETRPDEFKIKFGQFISDRRREKPYTYLTSVLKRAIRQRSVIPCIVFDNADNFPLSFQDAVFQYAYALYKAVTLSVVVVPITDRTIWRLSKAGALQSYSAKTFYLPVPAAKSVLEKRIQFIRKKLAEGPDQSRQYFSSRGLRVKMENLPAFAACVEEAFINTEFIARRIGSLTNYELRRGLELSQRIVTAPILKVDELVGAFFAKREVHIPERKVLQALLLGEYNKFKQDAQEYVLNMFALESGSLNSPLLRISMLRLLMDRENAASADALGSYIAFEEIDHYFESMGIATKTTLLCIEEMMKYRLVEPYEADADEITPTKRIAITKSGHEHIEMCFGDSVYLEQMALTTQMRSEPVVRSLREITCRKMGYPEWCGVRRIFAQYCLDEDALLVSIPTHSDYSSQARIRHEFRKWTTAPN
jgi:hypothetical protein